MLQAIAAILLRCFVLSIALLILWFVTFLLAGDLGYAVHARWFELSRHDFDLMNYYVMAVVKICSILFFLFPYVSIRLILRKESREGSYFPSRRRKETTP
jgi:heme/copper-type cytochrome/quinol oxidase subunit 2